LLWVSHGYTKEWTLVENPEIFFVLLNKKFPTFELEKARQSLRSLALLLFLNDF
jgi:hypothetical protein